MLQPTLGLHLYGMHGNRRSIEASRGHIGMGARETRQLIREEVIRQLNERPIDRIKVSSLTEELGIGRSTFYQYYDSVYSVLQEIEDELAAEIDEIDRVSFRYPFLDDYFHVPHPGILRVMQFCRTHYDELAAIFGPFGDENFARRCQRTMSGLFIERASEEGYIHVDPEERRFIISFFEGGHWSMVMRWRNDPNPPSDEDMAVLTYRLMFQTFRTQVPESQTAAGRRRSLNASDKGPDA